jgi:hypothetical protein
MDSATLHCAHLQAALLCFEGLEAIEPHLRLATLDLEKVHVVNTLATLDLEMQKP